MGSNRRACPWVLLKVSTAWFGASIPVGFAIGTYGGSAIGHSGTADAVNIFDASNAPVVSVSFGTGTSFDNAAGLTGLITQLSVVGVNSAFASVAGSEIGSPGFVSVPEPSSLSLLAASVGFTTLMARRRKASRS